MNRFFADTNFLLDLAIVGRPGACAAADLFSLIETGEVVGIASASSLKDFYYIARRDIAEAQRREWIRLFTDAFILTALDRETCIIALDSDEPDFEDGIIRTMAETENCDCIITRDENTFQESKVATLPAEKFLKSASALFRDETP